MPKKIFVLDTNVLMHRPESILSFEDNVVILPITVIQELDKHKTRNDEIGRNVRQAVRILDSLRVKGTLRTGVKTEKGGIVKIEFNNKDVCGADIPPAIDLSIADNRILAVAYNQVKKESKKNKRSRKEVWVLTKDISMRLTADALGLSVNDYNCDKVDIDNLYSGWREVVVEPGIIDQFYADKSLSLEGDFYPYEFVRLVERHNPKKTGLAQFCPEKKMFIVLSAEYETLYNLGSKNMEQRMAFEILLNPDIDLVTLVGRAGTGKTLLALAAGLHAVLWHKRYDKILVSRPIIPMGKDLGYMPGDKDEKLAHWMQPIFDNLTFLISSAIAKDSGGKKISNGSCGGPEDRNTFGDKIDQYLKSGLISLEALTYIRGRSIPKQFVIVDEAQNLTPHEIKTIISRAGEGTKMIFTGDPDQIDNPYLDSESNGLTYVVERLKNQDPIGHITLSKTERSRLAGIAAKYL